MADERVDLEPDGTAARIDDRALLEVDGERAAFRGGLHERLHLGLGQPDRHEADLHRVREKMSPNDGATITSKP